MIERIQQKFLPKNWTLVDASALRILKKHGLVAQKNPMRRCEPMQGAAGYAELIGKLFKRRKTSRVESNPCDM